MSKCFEIVFTKKKEGGSSGIRTKHLWVPTYGTYLRAIDPLIERLSEWVLVMG